MRIGGAAIELVEVGVLNRSLNRGETIQAADIAIERRPREGLPGDLQADAARSRRPRRPASAVGRSGRPDGRSRQAGDRRARRHGHHVYEVPGMTLTLRARATEAGAQGDTIAVQNVQSKQSLQATVVSPGRVAVSAATPGRSPALPRRPPAPERVRDHVYLIASAVPPGSPVSPLSRRRSAPAAPSTGSRMSARRPPCRRSRIRPPSRATSRCACRCPTPQPVAFASEFPVAPGLARLLQGPARRAGRRPRDGPGQVTDKAQIDNQTPAHAARTARKASGGNVRLRDRVSKVLPDGTKADALVKAELDTSSSRAPARSAAPSSSSPTSPRWSPRSCRTATSWSRASRRSGSISRSAS